MMELNVIEPLRKSYSKDEIKKILNLYNDTVLKIENIKIKDSDKARAVYKVYTDTGIKCLKKLITMRLLYYLFIQ
ncbi:hypothetical protein PL321_16000 [Caloramator sp. mosi_1]|uniref:hypothetical protein n=1 Tax=Caloramator sp. mosi_1 TaxID=3023090 RepID=UPI0023604ABD|nr:hypothetical protein [Caloramator sp. mosi_1]WDC83912.1 hypothetical protein PL321_16000 [Caloramator sp. mosi_1]